MQKYCFLFIPTNHFKKKNTKRLAAKCALLPEYVTDRFYGKQY